MSRRHALSDAQWRLSEPPLPSASRGRAWADHRRVIDGGLFWAATGVQWRDLPERFGPWQAVYERFRRWRDDGTWLRLLRAFQATADTAGLIDGGLFCVDPTSVRASRSAAGGKHRPRRAGRSRPGPQPWGVRDQAAPGHGRPRGAARTAGPAHETAGVEAALASVRVPRAGRGRPRSRPTRPAGDRGYDIATVRRRRRGRGIGAVIPARKRPAADRPRRGRPPAVDPAVYRRRNVIERCVCRLKECRRLATRFEELAVSDLALVHAAMLRDWLRLLAPLSDTP